MRSLPSGIVAFLLTDVEASTQACGPGLRASLPPLRTRAFTTSALMAVVVVDEVRSTRRMRHPDAQVLAWQRSLIRSLRDLCAGATSQPGP